MHSDSGLKTGEILWASTTLSLIACRGPGSYHEAYLRGLYLTQPTTNIDPKRVAEWGARIDAGERPFAIVTARTHEWTPFEEHPKLPHARGFPGEDLKAEESLVAAFSEEVDFELRKNLEH